MVIWTVSTGKQYGRNIKRDILSLAILYLLTYLSTKQWWSLVVIANMFLISLFSQWRISVQYTGGHRGCAGSWFVVLYMQRKTRTSSDEMISHITPVRGFKDWWLSIQSFVYLEKSSIENTAVVGGSFAGGHGIRRVSQPYMSPAETYQTLHPILCSDWRRFLYFSSSLKIVWILKETLP